MGSCPESTRDEVGHGSHGPPVSASFEPHMGANGYGGTGHTLQLLVQSASLALLWQGARNLNNLQSGRRLQALTKPSVFKGGRAPHLRLHPRLPSLQHAISLPPWPSPPLSLSGCPFALTCPLTLFVRVCLRLRLGLPLCLRLRLPLRTLLRVMAPGESLERTWEPRLVEVLGVAHDNIEDKLLGALPPASRMFFHERTA